MPVLFDSSIYIAALREGGDTPLLLRRWAEKDPIWIHAVVLHELYAGANAQGVKALAKLEGDLRSGGRILVPELNDWTGAGKILSRLARKYGYERIGRTRLTNDALIAVSAARTGMKLITANKRDFERIAEFCSLQWQEKSDFND